MVAQQGSTEAPAGFTTPALTQSPASQTFSNGVAEPPGDTFVADQLQFEGIHDPANGLGPLFNATSCAQCHQNNVTGAATAPAVTIEGASVEVIFAGLSAAGLDQINLTLPSLPAGSTGKPPRSESRA